MGGVDCGRQWLSNFRVSGVLCKGHYDAVFPLLSCHFWFCRSEWGPRNSFLVALGFLLVGRSKIYSLKVKVARGLGFLGEDEDHFEENR